MPSFLFFKVSDLFSVLILFNDFVNAVHRIEQGAQRGVVIQRIDDQRKELAHVTADIIRLISELFRLIHEIRRDQQIEYAVLVCAVEFADAAGKDAESRADKNALRLLALQELSGLKHLVSGGDHVVDDNDILAIHAGPEELVRDDRKSCNHGAYRTCPC